MISSNLRRLYAVKVGSVSTIPSEGEVRTSSNQIVQSDTASLLLGIKSSNDSYIRAAYTTQAGGVGKPGIVLGTGSATADTKLWRESTDIWKTDDNFQIGGYLSLAGVTPSNTSNGDIVGINKLVFSSGDANAAPKIYSSSGLIVQGDTNGILFKSNADDLLVKIEDGGNVSVGLTTVAKGKLHVNGGDTVVTNTSNPSFKINTDATDATDADRAFFGIVTSPDTFITGSVANDTVLRGRSTGNGKLLLGLGTTQYASLNNAGQFESTGSLKAPLIYIAGEFKLKNSSGILELRNDGDSEYDDLRIKDSYVTNSLRISTLAVPPGSPTTGTLYSDGTNIYYYDNTSTWYGLISSAVSSYIKTDDLSAECNGVKVLFNLTQAARAGSMRVFLNGLRQRAGGSNDYTETSSSSFTMNTAPLTGAALVVTFIKSTASQVNVETGDDLSAQCDDVTTIFIVTNDKYRGGSLRIYLNGVRLNEGVTKDYIESDAGIGEFTFTVAPESDDIVLCDYDKDTSAIIETADLEDLCVINSKVDSGIDTIKIGNGDVSNAELSLLNNSTDWVTWAPTYSASGSMTWLTITTTFARWRRIGKQVFIEIQASGTTGGVASNYLRFTLPINPVNNIYAGAWTKDSGNIAGFCFWESGPAVISVARYDEAVYSLGVNRQIGVVISYEIA